MLEYRGIRRPGNVGSWKVRITFQELATSEERDRVIRQRLPTIYWVSLQAKCTLHGNAPSVFLSRRDCWLFNTNAHVTHPPGLLTERRWLLSISRIFTCLGSVQMLIPCRDTLFESVLYAALIYRITGCICLPRCRSLIFQNLCR